MNIEEFVNSYLQEHRHDVLLNPYNGLIDFANTFKEQMLKDAYVESQIVEDGRIELEGNPLPCLNPIILLPYPQFQPSDKVRLIVLKAEEE